MCFRGRDWETSKDRGKDERSKSSLWTETSVNMSLILLKKQTDKKRAWEMMCREKPDFVKDRENERNLQRVATRGVVQLFNAVRKHQKTVDEKVKEASKDFINVLRGTEGGSEVVTKTERQTTGREAEEKPAWSVLRDDFMTGASMKDWDKESNKEGEEEEAPGGAEDYNSESD
uniref:RRP15-like protein n=1 Tax=Oncorhynchus tshawytscha TaxID=74940 RepID=A0A8C8IHA7_ONCTS